MQTKALLGRIYAFLTGRSRNLLDFATEVSKRKIRSQHYAGSRTVPINRIKGSEGRSGDFDCDFNPRHTHTRARWLSVAVARSRGDTLPLVELIQLEDHYFVRDWHHRISVARTFGEEYIDAKIIVLELEPVSADAGNRPTTQAE
ncbi:MAG TPA: transcriptional regulator, partial [Candidatus Binatia bacterium]|nr:transcriptional regulator [Candidatus Binatia bacterium]